jgi:exopolysaccharide biosynthesis protein
VNNITDDLINTNTETQSSDNNDTKKQEAVITENSYKDENISINIEKISEDGVNYYVADIKVADVQYLSTAFAEGTFGKNITEATSAMAQDNNAIFAINGDYYGFRDDGLIIRNSVIYRDNPKKAPYDESLALYDDGHMEIINENDADSNTLLQGGVYQTFSFGPTLVMDGKAVDQEILKDKSAVPTSKNPRTAIGQIEPLHYIIVVVDGRTKISSGMTLSELAQVFVDRGCSIAYNLDGGGSSTMYFNGKVVNYPTDGRYAGERKVSDIIYIEGSSAANE